MISVKYVSYATSMTVFVVLFAIILQAFFASNNLNRLTAILTKLLALEQLPSAPQQLPKIAVGYGSCSDLYVRAVEFLQPPAQQDSTPQAKNQSQFYEEVTKNFGYYFERGAAAERYIADERVFRELISKAKRAPAEVGTRWALGGNAPVMATRFLKDGAHVLLAAKMSTNLRKHLPADIQVSSGEIDEDDIHLIMEYKTGDTWGPYAAPRANRYIVHNDQHNPTISSLESFGELLVPFAPRLLVISGLQMMDNFPYATGVRAARLLKVREQILESHAPLVHFEMASYVEIALLQLLLDNVIPYSDSLGMNEQELDNLHQVLERGEISFAADSNPRVAKVLDQMRAVFRYVRIAQSLRPQNRLLTRIHVHTLAYQAIMTVENSPWLYSNSAAAKAALTAHRHVCASPIVNPEKSICLLDDSFATTATDAEWAQRIPLSPAEPVPCWNETLLAENGSKLNVHFCVAPVLVCKNARQTAGAGDNISAAGLILQI